MCLISSDSERALREAMEKMSFEELKEAILEKLEKDAIDKRRYSANRGGFCSYYFRKKLPEEIESIIVLSGVKLEYYDEEFA